MAAPRQGVTYRLKGRFRTSCTACPGLPITGLDRGEARDSFIDHCLAEHLGDIVPDNEVSLFEEDDR